MRAIAYAAALVVGAVYGLAVSRTLGRCEHPYGVTK